MCQLAREADVSKQTYKQRYDYINNIVYTILTLFNGCTNY